MGSCPGWQRKAKYYGLSSLYNACMTVKLKGNGTIIAQNAVIYAQCLEYKVSYLLHHFFFLVLHKYVMFESFAKNAMQLQFLLKINSISHLICVTLAEVNIKFYFFKVYTTFFMD